MPRSLASILPHLVADDARDESLQRVWLRCVWLRRTSPLLPTACCLLPAACCMLPATCCLLLAACCLLHPVSSIARVRRLSSPSPGAVAASWPLCASRDGKNCTRGAHYQRPGSGVETCTYLLDPWAAPHNKSNYTPPAQSADAADRTLWSRACHFALLSPPTSHLPPPTPLASYSADFHRHSARRDCISSAPSRCL